jgi:hypothetical protein
MRFQFAFVMLYDISPYKVACSSYEKKERISKEILVWDPKMCRRHVKSDVNLVSWMYLKF